MIGREIKGSGGHYNYNSVCSVVPPCKHKLYITLFRPCRVLAPHATEHFLRLLQRGGQWAQGI